MTEAEWDACADPTTMLTFLRGRAGERKVRLFSVACCRGMWPLLTDERSRHAVAVAEQFVDGKVSHRERMIAATAAWDAAATKDRAWTGAGRAAALAAARVVDRDWPLFATFQQREEKAGGYAWSAVADAGFFSDGKKRCDLLRCIFGNPFSPVSVSPALLAWNDRVVAKLAQVVYEERTLPAGTLDQARLAVLADALEDAGCADADILNHCREPGKHVRGCWVVDLLLGKS